LVTLFFGCIGLAATGLEATDERFFVATEAGFGLGAIGRLRAAGFGFSTSRTFAAILFLVVLFETTFFAALAFSFGAAAF